MRAARRLKLRAECVLDARQCFDRAVEREFPALRTLELGDVTHAHVCGQRGGSVLPEFRLKHGAVLSRRTRTPGARDAPLPRRAPRGQPARARTIPPESGIGSGRGFSCSECSAAAARLQTMKSHLWHKKK